MIVINQVATVLAKSAKACPAFKLLRATFTGEKLLRATCILTKIKHQLIASLFR